MLVFRQPLGYLGRPMQSFEDLKNKVRLAQNFAEIILDSYTEFCYKENADVAIVQTWYERDKTARKQKTYYFMAVE